MVNKKHDGDLQTYNDDFLHCRGLRTHTWSFETDFNIVTGPRNGRVIEFTKKLSCLACTTCRLDTYRVTKAGGFIFEGRKYEYADGYQVHRGNPIKMDAARDALLRKELAAQLDSELANRLLNMRPEARQQSRPPKLRAVV